MQLGEPSGPFLAALVPGRVLDLERSLKPQVLDDGQLFPYRVVEEFLTALPIYNA